MPTIRKSIFTFLGAGSVVGTWITDLYLYRYRP